MSHYLLYVGPPFAWWLLSNAVSALLEPGDPKAPKGAWYAWFYRFAHITAGNLPSLVRQIRKK